MADVVRDFAALFAGLPTAYLVMDRDLVIVDANRAYLDLLRRERADLVGRFVFDAFPPTADALDDQGRNPLETSFLRARDTGLADAMPLVQYDVLDATGVVEQRFWSLISAPLLGADGHADLVLQRVEDITEYVQDRERDRSRTQAVEAELFVRSREIEVARTAERLAADRMTALAEAALRLAQAHHHEELLEVVARFGLDAVRASRFEVAALSGDSSATSLDLWTVTRQDGRLVTTRGELQAAGDSMLAVATRTHRGSSDEECTVVPLRSGGRPQGAAAFCWAEPPTVVDVELVEAIAVQYGQAIARLRARDSERAVAADAVSMSEALQRSLLTDPRQAEDVTVVARYRPAAQRAQVGGDWYDSFRTAAGRTTLVVGDVSGHDEESAAVMSQVRNLLRGIAYCSGDGPATVLGHLDHALTDLEVGGLATSVMVTLEDDDTRGGQVMRWSNAGHPPPLLRSADGRARLLQTEPELLLGLDAGSDRTDHQLVLVPGSSVLLFTDGLVERRGSDVQEGLDWLQRTVAAMPDCGLEQMCDELLALVAGYAEDDVVLLAAQVVAPQAIDLRSVAAPGATSRPRRG